MDRSTNARACTCVTSGDARCPDRGHRDVARGRHRRRRHGGPAARARARRRRAPAAGGRARGGVPRGRRAVRRERPARGGRSRRTPTACTWASATTRTTARGRLGAGPRAGRQRRRRGRGAWPPTRRAPTTWASPCGRPPTKPDAEPDGLEGLGAVAEATALPVVGIGGIDAANAARRAGRPAPPGSP